MITIPNTLPSPEQKPVDVIRAGKTAARILINRVRTNTHGPDDFEHFMARVTVALEAAVELVEGLEVAQAQVKPTRTPRNEPFSVIDGGRS